METRSPTHSACVAHLLIELVKASTTLPEMKAHEGDQEDQEGTEMCSGGAVPDGDEHVDENTCEDGRTDEWEPDVGEHFCSSECWKRMK